MIDCLPATSQGFQEAKSEKRRKSVKCVYATSLLDGYVRSNEIVKITFHAAGSGAIWRNVNQRYAEYTRFDIGSIGVMSGRAYQAGNTSGFDIEEAMASLEGLSPDKPDQAIWVADIEDRLGYRPSQLAGLLHVTRQAVHDWKKGKAIRPHHRDRLHALWQAAVELGQNAPDGRLPPLWDSRTIAERGVAFFNGVQAGGDPRELACDLIRLWHRDRQERKTLAALMGGVISGKERR